MRHLAFLLMILCSASALAEAPATSCLIPMVGPAAGLAASPRGLPRVFVPTAAPASPGQLCRQAIRATEKSYSIPEHLMAAIARVESGRIDAQGVVQPWPWTINAEGAGHYFETKAEAITAVRALQGRGIKSVDIGCMQVNLLHHPSAFADLEQAFDPAANARYAAGFLLRLKDQTGNWPKATAAYHSATPDLGSEYEHRVAAVWPEEKIRQAAIPASVTGNVWTTNAWTQNVWNTGGPPLGGGQMLSNRADAAQIIPMTAQGAGRNLAAYRSAPIPIAARPFILAKIPPG
jgi:hypothetical protein